MTSKQPMTDSDVYRYAAAGDTVTCTGGHPIVDFAEDMYPGDPVCFEDLTNWRDGVEHHPGDYIDGRCHICSAPFSMAGEQSGGITFHFDGGWRWIAPDGSVEVPPIH